MPPKHSVERAKAAKQEEIDYMKEMMKQKGLGHEDYELPPLDEEGDREVEKKVKKSVYDSFMSLIPGTSAYYESQYAEEEMNDEDTLPCEYCG